MSDWTSDYTVFDFDRPHEKVLRLTLNETQPFNTLDERGHWEVANVWKHIDADPSINVAIVTGRGKAFSAGGHFDVEEKLMAENEVFKEEYTKEDFEAVIDWLTKLRAQIDITIESLQDDN